MTPVPQNKLNTTHDGPCHSWWHVFMSSRQALINSKESKPQQKLIKYATKNIEHTTEHHVGRCKMSWTLRFFNSYINGPLRANGKVVHKKHRPAQSKWKCGPQKDIGPLRANGNVVHKRTYKQEHIAISPLRGEATRQMDVLDKGTEHNYHNKHQHIIRKCVYPCALPNYIFPKQLM